MNETITRFHYRGSLQREYAGEELSAALLECRSRIEKLIRDGRIMTAALYHYKQMLFFYYEAISYETAPDNIRASEELPSPEELCSPLTPYLQPWPGAEGSRSWVFMYHIYYHALPMGIEDWKRPAVPALRRGRIAFLYPDKLYSYIYHHIRIVKEGLLTGDKYQSIALHENILFSYFEEPKTMMNVQRDLSRPSEAIHDWSAVDPESHFIHMPEGLGENFMFIPAYFALGTEIL